MTALDSVMMDDRRGWSLSHKYYSCAKHRAAHEVDNYPGFQTEWHGIAGHLQTFANIQNVFLMKVKIRKKQIIRSTKVSLSDI